MSIPTALTTFILHAPPKVFSVDLLGSWDNFQQPYSLARDKRAGEGQWRGCHRFVNIICDGDPSDASVNREGALKMGGLYWYYYRLNGDMDYCDTAKPVTTSCPSLPGQPVNVLELPMQHDLLKLSSRNGSASSLESFVFTLDPKDKYAPLGVRRSVTTSAIQHRKSRIREKKSCIDLSSASTTTASPDPTPTSSAYQGLSLRRSRSIGSMFNKLRRTKSATSNVYAEPDFRTASSWSRKLFSRSSHSRKGRSEEEVPEVPRMPTDVHLMPPIRSTSTTKLLSPPESLPIIPHSVTALPQRNVIGFPGSSVSQSGRLDMVTKDSPEEPRRLSKGSSFSPYLNTIQLDSAESLTIPDGCMTVRPKLLESKYSPAISDLAQSQSEPLMSFAKDEHLDSDAGQACPDLSPALRSTHLSVPHVTSQSTISCPTSPSLVSQPLTPHIPDTGKEYESSWSGNGDPAVEMIYDEDTIWPPPAVSSHQASALTPGERPSTSHAGAFREYRLPLHHYTSATTIKRPPSLDVMSRQYSIESNQPSKQELVDSWDDGSAQRLSALSSLVHDLGYLGNLIN